MPEDFLAKGVASVIVLAIAIFLFLFWVTMLADCAKKSFNKPSKKIFWLMALIVLQPMGAFIYWLAVQRKA